MLRPTEKQLRFHSLLYTKIPQNHILKVIDAAINFSFVYDIVADSYCRTVYLTGGRSLFLAGDC